VSRTDHDHVKYLWVGPHKRRKGLILLPNRANAKVETNLPGKYRGCHLR
jgi:hypothetical protein